MSDLEYVILFRPVGQQELERIQQNHNHCFPPRLPQQPFFYPVLTEQYATQIVRDWNAKYNEPKCGYRTGCRVRKTPIDRYRPTEHQEYWIPADELDEFNRNLLSVRLK